MLIKFSLIFAMVTICYSNDHTYGIENAGIEAQNIFNWAHEVIIIDSYLSQAINCYGVRNCSSTTWLTPKIIH